MPLLQRERYRFPRYVDDAAVTLRAAMQNAGGRVAEDRFELINRVIVTLREQGIWVKLDCLYLLAANDSASALINWKSPGTFNASEVSSPTFTADRGFTGNGTSSYLDTNFKPSTATSPQFVQNSGHFGVWPRTNQQENSADIGCNDPGSADGGIFPRSTSDVFFYGVNDGFGDSVSNANSSGFFVASRTGASSLAAYRNGASLATSATSSTGVGAANVIVCARDGGGFQASTRQEAAASIGSGLTSAEVSAFYVALLAYMQAVGRSDERQTARRHQGWQHLG